MRKNEKLNKKNDYDKYNHSLPRSMFQTITYYLFYVTVIVSMLAIVIEITRSLLAIEFVKRN
uniref:Uncharacterized protein n=1 Tax=viral metagenome TaxID=1070528 RepID=A0A6C0HB35_9ZZZZ